MYLREPVRHRGALEPTKGSTGTAMLASRALLGSFFLLLFTHGCSLINVVRHACIEVFFIGVQAMRIALLPDPC
jgi:hypothetical protein